MSTDYRQTRLLRLRAAQNADGGWGYFPQKQSWLEPTCYALLALYKDAASAEAWNRGWKLARSWQQPDGGFRPSAIVESSCWATALMVSIHCIQGVRDSNLERAIGWMLGVKGVEGGWLERVVNVVRPMPVEYDRRYQGWPWSPEAASWIEPTAHSLLALKKAAGVTPQLLLRERVANGERMIIDRRSADGGWNYGNRRVLKTNLPSYPETTAIALLGLQGSNADLSSGLKLAEQYWSQTRSRLAKAWLAITLRNYRRSIPPPAAGTPLDDDLMVTALESLACPEGGHQWLKVA